MRKLGKEQTLKFYFLGYLYDCLADSICHQDNFMREVRILEEKEKLDLAQLAAKDLGFQQDQLDFQLQ